MRSPLIINDFLNFLVYEENFISFYQCRFRYFSSKVGVKDSIAVPVIKILLDYFRSINPTLPHVMLEAVRLMAAVCLIPPDGHEKVRITTRGKWSCAAKIRKWSCAAKFRKWSCAVKLRKMILRSKTTQMIFCSKTPICCTCPKMTPICDIFFNNEKLQLANHSAQPQEYNFPTFFYLKLKLKVWHKVLQNRYLF